MKHWDKYEAGGNIDAFDFDNKMALINLNMIYEYAIKLDKLVSEDTELEEWIKMKLTRIEQNVSDVKHSLEGWEKFNQGGIIFKKQLLTISNYSKSLIDMIQGGSQLMSWQESKLAICANDIDGIYHHLDYKMGNRASEKYEMGGLIDKKEIEIQEYDKNTFIEFRVPSKIYNEIDAYVKVFFEYEEIEVSYLEYDEFIDVKEDAYFAYDYEVEFLTDSPTEITDEMKQQLNEEAKKVYDSYFHKYSYDGLFDIFANYAKYRKPENKYEAGGGISDKYKKASEYWNLLEVQMSPYQKKFYTKLLKSRLPYLQENFNDEEIAKYINGEIIEQFNHDLGIRKYDISGKNWFKLGFKYIAYRESIEHPEFWEEGKYESGKLSNGGNIDYDPRWSEMEAYSPYEKRTDYLAEQEDISDLAFASKKFSKSTEALVRKHLQNGEICMCKLRKILGREPDYPRQVVGSLVLTKSFMRNFYKI